MEKNKNLELKSNMAEDKIILSAQDISVKIIIDTKNKSIEKVKNFFEELLIHSFLEDTAFNLQIPYETQEILNKENEHFISFFEEMKEAYENSLKNKDV